MNRTCGFDREDKALPKLKTELWQGFLFVNFDADAPPLAPRLGTVEAAIANYDLAAAEGPRPAAPGRFPWNWKVMFENNNDGYHAS